MKEGINKSENPQSCKICLYDTNHPLGLTINSDGICSGCQFHEEKDTLDWAERFKRLQTLTSRYKSKNKKNYDCIVPISGANDSYFIVHIVKNILGMNPLLVSYNKYFNTPLGIRNLSNLRIKFDCDILIQNINPISVKKIVRNTLPHLGSLYWHCIAGQTVFPVQTAVHKKIPLIIWGAHQGNEQVGMFKHEHEVEMTRRYRKDHDLMGYEADDLITTFNDLEEMDIWQYRYPDDHDLKKIGVRGIYLGNFIRWDPKAQHELMIEKYGYESCKFSRTFDTYDHTDCYNFMNLHDKLKLYKHGYSKVLDHATREIRHKRITREQGLSLVSKYHAKSSLYEDLFSEWLEIDVNALQFVLNHHRSPLFWQENSPGEWVFKRNLDSKQGNYKIEKTFINNSDLNRNSVTKYITVGKGYP